LKLIFEIDISIFVKNKSTMKKIILLSFIAFTSLSYAQAFKGKGDIKGQVGASFQKGGNGIHVTTDFGIGENISLGLQTSLLLSTSEGQINDWKFKDRIDFKGRFNANIGNVINLDKKLDVYPGLDLGLKNFGAHLGARYFFTDGFGVYTEAGIPLAKYNQNDYDFNNQFVFYLGACFNL
jgi:outer membrane protein G